MEKIEIKLMIESWLLLDKDHTVRIEKFNEADIVARNVCEYDCKLTPFEYVEFVPYCPCCEQRQDIYHNLDDIDFSGRTLSFENPSGKEVKQLTINH